METNTSINDVLEVNDKIQIILRQTNYTEEEANEKLKKYDFDHLRVIKSYFGITEKKAPLVKSVNQEIYRQLRQNLDSSIRDYKIRVENGSAKKLF